MSTHPAPGTPELAAWLAAVPVDTWGLPYAYNGEGFYYPTPCCGASAKGCDGYTGCRRCYAEIDPSLGGIPEPDPSREAADAAALREAHGSDLDGVSLVAVFAADRERTAAYREFERSILSKDKP